MVLPSASALASRREERVQKAFSVDHHEAGDARLSHSASGVYGAKCDYVRSWPPERWGPMLVQHGMLCASARVRRTTWAARLGVRAAASTRSVSGRAAALARRGRATFATILGAQAGGPARPRTRCSRLCAGAPVLRPGQSQRCLDAVRGRRMRRLLGGGRAA